MRDIIRICLNVVNVIVICIEIVCVGCAVISCVKEIRVFFNRAAAAKITYTIAVASQVIINFFTKHRI